MKIVVTGSLGNISKPLVMQLIAQGHDVTVISSSESRKVEIESLGAKAAIGKIKDIAFLSDAFAGQDAAYCMIPPFNFFAEKNLDYRKETSGIADNYFQAIQKAGIKKVVHLSSVGAEKAAGAGVLDFHYLAESILKKLPSDVDVIYLRPASFDYNLYAFMDMIKGNGFLKGIIGKLLYLRHYGFEGLFKGYSGIILSNYGGDDKIAWVSPIDIAAAIAEEITADRKGKSVRYVASDELTCQEIATILGNAIGKPYLKWALISDKQMNDAFIKIGASETNAKAFTEMNAAIHNGSLFEEYFNNRPAKLGNVKIKDFANDFALKYNAQ
ncbi:NAD-dependent epimerase/dehydratase family protein [Mucilaginibacter pallidiroseus]|uniref:NAD-dependent epimerase/dehydratase family protein n=1 Tax=Mucilaginibacter pallidiroseus TaxID=2599295 RepID=A0A563UBS7_9SPHI|nr:NAD(P)H-binding protein [Mucilaginibacter pallidiroseus]TWR28828.1 NAD-dependent epimerase/dehydratase family protein [Mucilaginibacter pallidiroseus]